MTTLIRVFPRRTSMTPVDPLAFVGDPPMIRPQADEVHVSVTFTWDMAEGRRLALAWGQYYGKVELGGPVLASPGGGFTPGKYVRDGVTFTSRGCNNLCPWCLVPEREGKLRELPDITPGYIVQDNNLLQCSWKHLNRVFTMLKREGRAVSFRGGIDARFVDDWFAEELKGLPVANVFLACDTEAGLEPLRRAVKRLAFLGRNKLYCYVLLAYNGESMEQGLTRLRNVWEAGCIPFAQLYQLPEKYIEYPPEWRRFARLWCRPAAIKAMMR